MSPTHRLLALLLLPTTALSHWMLHQPPPNIAFNELTEATAPCGGGDPANRSVITEWPISGYPVNIMTLHAGGTFAFRVADAANLAVFNDLTSNITMEGVGTACFSFVPGSPTLKDAVVQIIRDSPDEGLLYQCTAVTFVDSLALANPPDCVTSAGVSWKWQTPPRSICAANPPPGMPHLVSSGSVPAPY